MAASAGLEEPRLPSRVQDLEAVEVDLHHQIQMTYLSKYYYSYYIALKQTLIIITGSLRRWEACIVRVSMMTTTKCYEVSPGAHLSLAASVVEGCLVECLGCHRERLGHPRCLRILINDPIARRNQTRLFYHSKCPSRICIQERPST